MVPFGATLLFAFIYVCDVNVFNQLFSINFFYLDRPSNDPNNQSILHYIDKWYFILGHLKVKLIYILLK